MPTQLWAVILTLLAAFIGSIGPILLKKAAPSFRLSIKALLTNYYLLAGVFFYGIGTVLFIPALRGGDLSILYPLLSTTYIWVCWLSTKLLHEKMNRLRWGGIALIIIGVSFLGVGA